LTKAEDWWWVVLWCIIICNTGLMTHQPSHSQDASGHGVCLMLWQTWDNYGPIYFGFIKTHSNIALQSMPVFYNWSVRFMFAE
jgi:hypothetical protein